MNVSVPSSLVKTNVDDFQCVLDSMNWVREAYCDGEVYLSVGGREVVAVSKNGEYYIPPKLPPTESELLQALQTLDKLDGTKLVTEHEELAIAVVSDLLVALSDPEKLHEYEMNRVNLRVKVWHEIL